MLRRRPQTGDPGACLDVAYLVSTAELMLRTLRNFFLIGGLLFSAKALYESRRVEGPEISVQVAGSGAPRISRIGKCQNSLKIDFIDF